MSYSIYSIESSVRKEESRWNRCVFILRTIKGELVGAWFTPPVDFDEIKERIGLNNEYENMRFMIMNFLLRLMSTPIEEINRLCGLAEELEGTPIGEVASEIQHAFFNSFEEWSIWIILFIIQIVIHE